MSLNASCRLWYRLAKYKRPSYLGSRCLWTLIRLVLRPKPLYVSYRWVKD
nr:MAG TPA: hypothetical protein [Caudoviricetes sp.]